jgi:hypothetical protein
MSRANVRDALLLALAAASLLFGGGIGCDPELDGTALRPATFDSLRYVAFYGKKLPGNGWAVLHYPIVPTASIEATVGVVNPRYFQASEDAEGCLGLRDDTGFDWRICATYQIPANLHITSSLSGDTADCPGATGALLRFAIDSMNMTAWYQCPSGSLTELESVPTQWSVGEKWNLIFGGYNLGKGAEVGYSGLRYDSAGPFEDTDDGDIAFDSFRAFKLGLDAFYEFDAGNFGGGIGLAFTARSALISATTETRNLGAFPDTNALKHLTKADKTYFKLVDGLFPDKFGKYFKTFPKVAEEEACAMEDEEDFF